MGHTNIHPEVLRTARGKVGEYLRGIREHRQLKVEDLAEKAGIDIDLVVAMESGDHEYTVDELFAVTNALDCYFYLSDRGGKHLDGDDMIAKMKDPV